MKQSSCQPGRLAWMFGSLALLAGAAGAEYPVAGTQPYARPVAPFVGIVVICDARGTLHASSSGKAYSATRAAVSSGVSSRPTMRWSNAL